MKRSLTVRSGVLFLAFIMVMSLIYVVPTLGDSNNGTTAYAASADATGKVDAAGGAYMRSGTSTSAKTVALLKNNTKITIMSEVFLKKNSTKANTRWFYIKANGKTGYIRSDLVKSINFSSLAATTTAALNYRVGPGTGMKKMGTIKSGKSVKVLLPAKLSGAKDTWYRIKIGSGTYYMSGSYLKFSSAASSNSSASASATPAASNSQTEPAVTTAVGTARVTVSGISKPTTLYTGQAFTLKGTLKSTKPISKVTVGITNTDGSWVLQDTQEVNASSFNIAKADRNISFGKLSAGKYIYKAVVYNGDTAVTVFEYDFKVMVSEVAAKLLANPTSGGAARNVYTFNSSNCTRLFSVQGYGSAKVPQGMSYTVDSYHIVFGMSNAQSIVTYSANGKRGKAYKFPYNVSHPNGMTWNPSTGLCYVFIGSQKKIHTWNPANGKFGTAYTPYSSSGIAYDSSTNLMYASSLTGIRVYSADGKFSHRKLFSRCTRGGKTYIQDCGSSNGFVFHGVSGADKHKTNYLDIYRVSDGSYLGSVIVDLDEIESVIVDKDGFVQLLINTRERTDYVYRTPLNVRDLIQ